MLDGIDTFLVNSGAMKRPATMQDIACETGLSPMTVSRVLSNRGHVSPQSRTLILAAARKLDYHINSLGRQLNTNRSHLLGVITPFRGLVGTHYFGQVLQGVQQALSATGFHVALFDSQSREFNDGRKWANLCRQWRVDGLIVVAPERDDRFPLTFANFKVPVVVVGRSFNYKSISYVDVDNFGAAAAVTKYLIRLGHRKIGFLRGASNRRDAAQRELAFRKTLAAEHVPIMEKWIVQGDYETRKAFHIALALLSKENRPTAIFASNDLMAYGVIDAARMLKLNVPEDLSVAGFDDLEGSAECVPPLTTTAQPMRQLGQVAASYLLDRLNASGVRSGLHVKLSAQLVIRASTAPPAQNTGKMGLGRWGNGGDRKSGLN